MEYSAGANQQEIESLLVLGFGGSGQDLKKSFDVTYQGEETIDNIATAKLQLIPKNEKLRSNYFRKSFCGSILAAESLCSRNSCRRRAIIAWRNIPR